MTRGLIVMQRTWIAERISQVLELSDALLTRRLPANVSYEDAELRHAQLKVELYEAMAAERPGCEDITAQLVGAKRRLADLSAASSPDHI